MNEVQTKIAELQDRGWSLAALADELGVGLRTVRYWRNGGRYPENAKAVLALLNSIGRKRNIPKRKRYPGTHHLQVKAKDKAESGE